MVAVLVKVLVPQGIGSRRKALGVRVLQLYTVIALSDLALHPQLFIEGAIAAGAQLQMQAEAVGPAFFGDDVDDPCGGPAAI